MHEKFSTRPPEKHQSTPAGSSGHCSQNTNTLPLLYSCAAPPPRLCSHKLSSSAVLHFLRPFGSYRCEGGERGKGEGGRDGRERGPDHPALMAGLSVYICRGSLCNTSGILRPLSPARDGGGQEREGESESFQAAGREVYEREGEGERESGEGWPILLTVSSGRSVAGLWFLNKSAAKNAKCKQSTRRHLTMSLVNKECNREQIHGNEKFFKISFLLPSYRANLFST